MERLARTAHHLAAAGAVAAALALWPSHAGAATDPATRVRIDGVTQTCARWQAQASQAQESQAAWRAFEATHFGLLARAWDQLGRNQTEQAGETFGRLAQIEVRWWRTQKPLTTGGAWARSARSYRAAHRFYRPLAARTQALVEGWAQATPADVARLVAEHQRFHDLALEGDRDKDRIITAVLRRCA